MTTVLAPALLEGWSWLRFACSAPHSPSVDPEGGGCRRCDCEGFASFTSASRSLAAEARTLSGSTPAGPPVPNLLDSEGTEFPIHAEPSNNSKQRPRGQADIGWKIDPPALPGSGAKRTSPRGRRPHAKLSPVLQRSTQPACHTSWPPSHSPRQTRASNPCSNLGPRTSNLSPPRSS